MKKMSVLAILSFTLALGLTACDNSKPAPSKSSSQDVSSTESISSALDSSSNESNSSSSTASSSSSAASSSLIPTTSFHTHTYGNLVEGYLPSYFYDGSKSYYVCSGCGKYFDVNKNPTTQEELKLPRATDDIAFVLEGAEKENFVLVEKTDNHASWAIRGRNVSKDSTVEIAKPGYPEYKYAYFNGNNVSQDHKSQVSGFVNIFLDATPNGFVLSIEDARDLVVKINNNEYPLNKVNYYESNVETFIYGYHYFEVGDVMTVVDKTTNVVYDYDDLEDDTKWDTFDFHRGTNGEIVFDYKARFGIEFNRDGDKLISITKTFGPQQTISSDGFDISFVSSSRPSAALESFTISKTSPDFESMAWYLTHEKVINNSDIVGDIDEKGGLLVYQAVISLEENEHFTINNGDSYTFGGEHLCGVSGDEGCIAAYKEYMTAMEKGTYTIMYFPSYQAIFIYSRPESSEIYMVKGGSFDTGISLGSKIVAFSDVRIEKNDYIAFVDSSYNQLTLTLDPNSDPTLVRFSSFLVYANKAGTFNFVVNANTNVLTVTAVSLDPDEGEILTPKYVYGGSLPTTVLTTNPQNSDELYVADVERTIGSYLMFYDATYATLEDITLDSSSASYGSVMVGTMIYFSQAGTYNIYIHKTTHVVRLVKTA